MKLLVILDDGFEEIEAFTVVDVLRRANIEVNLCGVKSTIVAGSHNVKIIADSKLDGINLNFFDAIFIPGGRACKSLMSNSLVLNIIKDFYSKKKLITAICAAPLVLSSAGILKDKKATVYPGHEKDIPNYEDMDVVVDDRIITSRAPGTAMKFALRLVEYMVGETEAEKLKKEMVVKC